MRATQQLIDALRCAADRIESPGSDYWWGDGRTCNCGILYQQLFQRIPIAGVWRHEAGIDDTGPTGELCEVTYLPVSDLVKDLLDAGLTRMDVAWVEACCDAVVLERLGIGATSVRVNQLYKEPSFVARYFRAQADILEEQLARQPVKPPVPQSCTHLFLADVCVYCSHVRPAVNPVAEIA